MSEIVLLHHNEPMTTSLAVAAGTDNEHDSVILLVRKYLDDLENFGKVGFEMAPEGISRFEIGNSVVEVKNQRDSKGRRTEFAFLNEPQATLLITFMRNSDTVRRFKVALVKAFYELRDKLAAAVPPAPTFMAVDHRADVIVSADRTFRAIMRSSRAVGLRLPRAIERANFVTRQQTGIDMLATIGLPSADLGAGDDEAGDFGVSDFGAAWLAGNLPLPATICRSSDLYAAYLRWRGNADVCPINRFSRLLLDASPILSKRHVTAIFGGRDVRMRCFIAGDPLRDLPPGSIGKLAATEIERFSVALADWQPESG
jgi:phage regulator Rha-like protein